MKWHTVSSSDEAVVKTVLMTDNLSSQIDSKDASKQIFREIVLDRASRENDDLVFIVYKVPKQFELIQIMSLALN